MTTITNKTNTPAGTVRLQKGDRFKIFHGRHWGRTYRIEGFGFTKWGIRHAICRWSDNAGDCELMSESDLLSYAGLFRLWDTSGRQTDREFLESTPAAAA